MLVTLWVEAGVPSGSAGPESVGSKPVTPVEPSASFKVVCPMPAPESVVSLPMRKAPSAALPVPVMVKLPTLPDAAVVVVARANLIAIGLTTNCEARF